jgi:hypothetical protein
MIKLGVGTSLSNTKEFAVEMMMTAIRSVEKKK